jgi:hypothetical protein
MPIPYPPRIKPVPARATINGKLRVGYYFEKGGQHHFTFCNDIMSPQPTEHWVLPFEAIEIADLTANPTSPLFFPNTPRPPQTAHEDSR